MEMLKFWRANENRAIFVCFHFLRKANRRMHDLHLKSDMIEHVTYLSVGPVE